jgi:hypothetical protein
MATRYIVSNDSFEVIARNVTLEDAAAIVGRGPSWLANEIDRNGCACAGQFDVDIYHSRAGRTVERLSR